VCSFLEGKNFTDTTILFVTSCGDVPEEDNCIEKLIELYFKSKKVRESEATPGNVPYNQRTATAE
jgi:hypothetical protein